MSEELSTTDYLDELRGGLLRWYDGHHRELPWRSVEDPYATWVSEVMLQQTQVTTVIDYFERWMERFPDVQTLAEADLDDVLEVWAGLGYYRRARFLHAAASQVIDEFDACLPSTVDELRELKGIGPYTAGAIASIAFGKPVPVVDGNVSRVLARLFEVDGDPRATETKRRFWSLAGEMVPDERPGDFNQSLMELGATVCTPSSPSCLLCPIREHCGAFASGDPTAYPEPTRRVEKRPVTVRTAVVHRETDEGDHEFIVVQRPLDGLLGGLWEFPTVEEEDGIDIDDYLRGELSLQTEEPNELGEVVHLFTHLRMTLDVQSRRLLTAGESERRTRWVTRDDLADIALSAAMRKVEGLLDV